MTSDWTPQQPYREGQAVKLPDGTEVTLGAAVTASDDEWAPSMLWAGAEETHRDPWAGLPEYRVARFTFSGPRADGSFQDVRRVPLGTIVAPDGIRWWVTTTWDPGGECHIRYLRCDIWEIQP